MTNHDHSCKACAASQSKNEVHQKLLEDLQRGIITPDELRERMAALRQAETKDVK